MTVPRAQWDQTIELDPYDPASLHTEACAFGRDRVTRDQRSDEGDEDEEEAEENGQEKGTRDRQLTEVSPTTSPEGPAGEGMDVPRRAWLE